MGIRGIREVDGVGMEHAAFLYSSTRVKPVHFAGRLYIPLIPTPKGITRTALSQLCDCLQLYTPSRTPRSASDTLSLQIPRIRLSTVGSSAFSIFGPSTCRLLS